MSDPRPGLPRIDVVSDPRVRTALLVVLALLAAVLVLRPVQPAGAEDTNWDSLAALLADDARATGDASAVTGGYLPGSGLVFHARLSGVPRARLDRWLVGLLRPRAGRLESLGSSRSVTWSIEADAAMPWTRLVRIPGDHLLEPAHWQETSGLPGEVTTGEAPVTAPTPDPATATAPAAAPTSATASSPGTGTAAPTSGATGAPAATGDGRPGGDDFSGTAEAWTAMTGTWAIADGVYRQTDASGYDYITQFKAPPPTAFTVSVRLRAAGDKLGGGLILGQPQVGSRKGAVMVDVTDGSYLRWGTYDSSAGTYEFAGGVSLPGTAGKGEWHTLSVEVAADGTTISWDEDEVGQTDPVAAGHVGLVTSLAAVDFDDFSVSAP